MSDTGRSEGSEIPDVEGGLVESGVSSTVHISVPWGWFKSLSQELSSRDTDLKLLLVECSDSVT